MRLSLPPSPSVDAAQAGAEWLQSFLTRKGCDVTVGVARSYAALSEELESGAAALAWAPPLVCARVEIAGGHVALRCVRKGETRYRAALVVRADDTFDLTGLARRTAAWVDEDSASGYLLARAWLASHGIDARTGFRSAVFVGSFSSALQAVARGDADVCSIFASADGTRSTLDEVEASLKHKLRIHGVVGETQNDGIAVGPGVVAASVLDELARMGQDPDGGRVLSRVLRCDELRRCDPTPTSTSLTQMVRGMRPLA